jgi:hypothetical protein
MKYVKSQELEKLISNHGNDKQKALEFLTDLTFSLFEMCYGNFFNNFSGIVSAIFTSDDAELDKICALVKKQGKLLSSTEKSNKMLELINQLWQLASVDSDNIVKEHLQDIHARIKKDNLEEIEAMHKASMADAKKAMEDDYPSKEQSELYKILTEINRRGRTPT